MRFAGGHTLQPRGAMLRVGLLWATVTAPAFFVGGAVAGLETGRYLWLDRPGAALADQARTARIQTLRDEAQPRKRHSKKEAKRA